MSFKIIVALILITSTLALFRDDSAVLN